MPVTPTPVFPQTIRLWSCSITSGQSANSTTPLACVTGGANGSKVDALWMTNSATAGVTVSIYWSATTTGGIVSSVAVSSGAGLAGATPHLDVLRHAQLPALSYDAFGNKCMYLSSGTVLSFMTAVLPNSGQISIFAQGCDF